MSKAKKAAPRKKVVHGANNPHISNPDSDVTQTICSSVRTLYEERKQRKRWTQEQLAEYIGVPVPYMKGVLQGRFAPSHAVLLEISKKFSVTMDWIYGLSK